MKKYILGIFILRLVIYTTPNFLAQSTSNYNTKLTETDIDLTDSDNTNDSTENIENF